MATAPAPALAPEHDGKMRLLVSRTRPPKLAEYLAGVLDAELVPLGSAGAKTMAVIQGHADVTTNEIAVKAVQRSFAVSTETCGAVTPSAAMNVMPRP